jgi:hypothetical protein
LNRHDRGVDAAFFLPTDDPDRFVSTGNTVGPWAAGLQHAGPPSALVARAVERLPSTVDGPAQVARLTVEILGAVPVADLTVRAAVARSGRSVELVEAELLAGDRAVLRARAWRIRHARLDLPPGARGAPEPAPPRPAASVPFTDPVWRGGYLDAVEWRFVSGTFERTGPATVWARQRVPLVAGEEPSPLQRLALIADSGNGISRVLEVGSWWFINTELTLHLHRAPAGAWMCLRARTVLGESGMGLAETLLYDERGPLGRGAQALMVGPR